MRLFNVYINYIIYLFIIFFICMYNKIFSFHIAKYLHIYVLSKEEILKNLIATEDNLHPNSTLI